jgi:hypothetical protein
VTSVLRSAAIKRVVPILSTRVEKVFLCLVAILNLRNARVLFIMAKRHPVRNSHFMKAIRDVHSFKKKASTQEIVSQYKASVFEFPTGVLIQEVC